MAKPSERAEEMQKLLREFATSGQTRRQFCDQHELPLSTLDYWRRQLQSQPRWVRVEVKQQEEASRGFTLRLENGRSIQSRWQFIEEELARLIRIAERA